MYILGTWIVKDIHPTPEGKAQKVKVKVRVNLNGIMNISSASLIESKESPEADGPEEAQKPNENSEQPQTDANGQPPEVGSSGWTKKISAWFSRVRELNLALAWRFSVPPFTIFFIAFVAFVMHLPLFVYLRFFYLSINDE